MNPLEITLLILLVTILAFVSGKVPFSVISTGIILALILTGIKTPAEAFGGFINTNVVMFVAMFVIGAGLTKTPLIDKAQSLVIRYKDNMRMLIFLSCVAGAFLGAITSATATAAIMIPLLVGIANDIGVSRSKLLYPSMACANIATQMTFLGQGASNMAWNDVMMQAGAPTPLHIWDFTIARIPMLTIAILYMTFVGYKLMPDIPNEQFSDAAHTAAESEKLSPFKRNLAVLIVLVSIAMMLLENVIGVKMYLTSCIGAAALVLTGVLTEKEALNSIHQPTIFLFAGVLALSDAIQTTGAGDVVADWMIRLLGDTTNPYIIMLVFFLVSFILTQVMSNLATLTIFIPLVTSACIESAFFQREKCLCRENCSLCVQLDRQPCDLGIHQYGPSWVSGELYNDLTAAQNLDRWSSESDHAYDRKCSGDRFRGGKQGGRIQAVCSHARPHRNDDRCPFLCPGQRLYCHMGRRRVYPSRFGGDAACNGPVHSFCAQCKC